MTRINLIDVEDLSDQHLLAEHREIKRIPNCILKGRYNLDGIPEKYVLGKGHVKFFYNKLTWLFNRYNKLYSECLSRGFNIQFYGDVFLECVDKYPELSNNWKCNKEEIDISMERIQEKINMKPGWYKWTRY